MYATTVARVIILKALEYAEEIEHQFIEEYRDATPESVLEDFARYIVEGPGTEKYDLKRQEYLRKSGKK